MDCNTFESTYGRRYPLEHNGYPYPNHQQQWQPYYQPWNCFDQGNISMDFNYDQSCSSTYYDESSNNFHEEQAGNYINEPSNPYFSSDFNQTPPQDEEAELKERLYKFIETSDASLNNLQDFLKESEERHDSIKRLGEQINMLVRVVEENIISPSTPCENKEESQQEDESCELEGKEESQQEEESCELKGEVESMAEAIEEGKCEVAIEQSEQFPTEKPLETRVEDKTEIGYSYFESDEFVIPPYVPSPHLQIKIMLGQVKGEGRWLIQLKIYFLEATKGKERILSSTPNFFMFSMKHCKGMTFLMHGWHNFPFDPGGVEQWSG